VIQLSAMFCPLWFAANFTFSYSLTMTSVSSNTILSTTSGLFTLVLGALLGIDKFTITKLIAVLLSIGGVTIVSLADRNDSNDTVWGDLLSLLSAVFYACYGTFLKKKIRTEQRLDTPMFFGFLGAINCICLLPLFPILDTIGMEYFELPSKIVLLYLFVNGLIGSVLSDYLWLLGVLLTSPLIATLGLSLSTVLAICSDFFWKQYTFSWMYLVGTASIIGGFLLVNIDVFFNIDTIVKVYLGKYECRGLSCFHPETTMV